MDVEKWKGIYNSLIRVKFYIFLDNYERKTIDDFNKRYENFIDKHRLPRKKNEEVLFFGGDILFGFAYLILVRTFEYIDKPENLTNNERDEILKIDNWNIVNISTYNDFISKYSITVNKLTEIKGNGDRHYTNDSEKLEYFIKRIRNSVSHFRYEYPDMQTIKLTDKKHKNTTNLEMECLFKYHHFFNFCMDYCQVVNDKLYELHNK